jgi:hypothetical protein
MLAGPSDNPRAAESEQVSYATYDSWMSDCISQPAPYVDNGCCIKLEHLADLMRLRLGALWLNVVTGRWTNGGTERTHRYCRKCMAYAIEDEKHFLMECPAYQAIRADFKSCSMIVEVTWIEKAYVSS